MDVIKMLAKEIAKKIREQNEILSKAYDAYDNSKKNSTIAIVSLATISLSISLISAALRKIPLEILDISSSILNQILVFALPLASSYVGITWLNLKIVEQNHDIETKRIYAQKIVKRVLDLNAEINRFSLKQEKKLKPITISSLFGEDEEEQEQEMEQAQEKLDTKDKKQKTWTPNRDVLLFTDWFVKDKPNDKRPDHFPKNSM